MFIADVVDGTNGPVFTPFKKSTKFPDFFHGRESAAQQRIIEVW